MQVALVQAAANQACARMPEPPAQMGKLVVNGIKRTPPSAWRVVCERTLQTLGEVSNSSLRRNSSACSRVVPHISKEGCNPEHTAGRSASPKSRQRRSASRCGQGTPAGLPFGRPGIGLLMEGSMQQAAQPGRQPSGSIPGLGEGAGMAGIVTQNGGIK